MEEQRLREEKLEKLRERQEARHVSYNASEKMISIYRYFIEILTLESCCDTTTQVIKMQTLLLADQSCTYEYQTKLGYIAQRFVLLVLFIYIFLNAITNIFRLQAVVYSPPHDPFISGADFDLFPASSHLLLFSTVTVRTVSGADREVALQWLKSTSKKPILIKSFTLRDER